MPFIPGRSPNPSYFRGIPGAKDGDSHSVKKGTSNGPPPEGRELGSPGSTGWRSSGASTEFKPETVKITPAEQRRRVAAIEARAANGVAERERRAGGAPDAGDRNNLRTFSRAQLTDARPLNHQEAANILDVMAEKGRDGMLTASELKTVSTCVSVVKKMKADPNDAQQALKKLLATQNPTTRGAETLKKLLESLG